MTWRIGVITLSTDAVTEHDFAAMRPDDRFRIYASRVRHINPTTKENLARIAPQLIDAASLILSEQKLDVIAYSCTAASAVIGDDNVRRSVTSNRLDVECVTPSSSALAALSVALSD